MEIGHDARSSSQEALNEFADNNPTLAPVLGKVVRLVEASDAPTLDRYDHALSAYIETGDESAINALAPMIAADAVALVVHNGELEAGDVTEASVESALWAGVAPEVVQAAAQHDAAPAEKAVSPSASLGLHDAQEAVGVNEAQMSPYQGANAAGFSPHQARWDAGASRSMMSLSSSAS